MLIHHDVPPVPASDMSYHPGNLMNDIEMVVHPDGFQEFTVHKKKAAKNLKPIVIEDGNDDRMRNEPMLLEPDNDDLRMNPAISVSSNYSEADFQQKLYEHIKSENTFV